jgi:O-antigen/teichoic acid export membrane protein
MTAVLGHRRRVARLAGSAGAAQVVSSLSNALIAIVVAREAGQTALGQFGLLFVVLTLFVAVQTAWVGDALTVLERDPVTERGLAATQWAHAAAGLVLAPVVAALTVHTSLGTSILFGVLVAAWEMEELGRRALMSRLAFGGQLLSDGTYLAVSLGVAVALGAATRLSLALVLVAMLAGALAATVVAFVLLPVDDLRLLVRPGTDGVGRIASFGIWRAAQSGSGYLVQLAVRYSVVVAASTAVLGAVEAARIIVSPAFIVLASASNVLLPVFARSRLSRGATSLAAGILVGGSILYGAIAFAARRPLSDLLYGHGIQAPASATLAWIAAAVGAALATPYLARAVAEGKSRGVFVARTVGGVVAITVAVAVAAAGSPRLTPAALGVGTLLTVAVLRGGGRYRRPR